MSDKIRSWHRIGPCPAALVQGVQPGQELLLDDGRLLARVDTAEPEALVCTVVRGGVLQSLSLIHISGCRTAPARRQRWGG